LIAKAYFSNTRKGNGKGSIAFYYSSDQSLNNKKLNI